MKRLLLFLLNVCITGYAFAYPITPRPLRQLIIESEYIVTGTVLEMGKWQNPKGNQNSWFTDYAVIVVEELLQGKKISDTITVYYTSQLLCPAPAKFILHSKMIAFLDKTEKPLGYTVHALSYGVKNDLHHEGIAVYKKRIVEMQRILRMEKGNSQERKIIEWLVTCAESPNTRWEGAYELMAYRDQGDGCSYKMPLSSTQKRRLFDAVMVTPSLGSTEFMLMDFCKGIDDASLLELLKKNLVNVPTSYWWVGATNMRIIIDLTGATELKGMVTEFSKRSSFSNSETEEKEKVRKLFIEKIGSLRIKAGEVVVSL